MKEVEFTLESYILKVLPNGLAQCQYNLCDYNTLATYGYWGISLCHIFD